MRANTSETILGIQFLRGLAALAVVFHHLLEELIILFQHGTIPRSLIVSGASGVDLFFVISGFIMLYTSEHRFGRSGAAADFAVRRIIRIVPLYWLCTLAIVAFALTGIFYKNKIITADYIVSSLFFMPTDGLILGVGWTLQYEMYFYLIFTLCLLFGTARLTIFALPLVLSAMIGLSQLLPASPAQRFFASPLALEFAFGLWLAYGFSRGRLPKLGPVTAAVLGVTIIAMSSMLVPSHDTAGLSGSMRFLLWGVPASMLVYASLFIAKIEGPVGRMLYLIGNASYSIYLTHDIVMTCYAKLIKTESVSRLLPAAIWMALAAGAAIAVGLLSYKLIEHPVNEWLKRRWKARGQKPAAYQTPASV